MTNVGPAGRVTVRRGKNFNVAIFSDAINVTNVELCIMVLMAHSSQTRSVGKVDCQFVHARWWYYPLSFTCSRRVQ